MTRTRVTGNSTSSTKRGPGRCGDRDGLFGCYCRVSTSRQKNDSQRAEISRWLRGNGIRPDVVVWYEDKETGKTLKRPGFDRLKQAIFEGRIKTVVVWKLDRISRRQREGINLLADWCDRGIRVVVVTQQIDLTGAVGRMVASVMFGLAEIELEYRHERQAAGIAVAKAHGVYKGRKRGTTKANPQRAHELRRRGLIVPEIATSLGVSVRTVHRYLQICAFDAEASSSAPPSSGKETPPLALGYLCGRSVWKSVKKRGGSVDAVAG